MTDTRDARNALKAVDSLHEANTDDLYLYGISAGGGIALLLASQVQDVRAMVAVSPFVGFPILEYWEKRLNDPSFNDYMVAYAQAACTPAALRAASAYDHVQGIHAPVLLRQGKQEHVVMWQTVESLYQRMKADHKTVKLVLYPHGHHGLDRSHWYDSTMQAARWLRKYGLPGLWWSVYVAEKGPP
jgi:dipeptidyl aminopeptidase/acylaminoacyl peptidase